MFILWIDGFQTIPASVEDTEDAVTSKVLKKMLDFGFQFTFIGYIYHMLTKRLSLGFSLIFVFNFFFILVKVSIFACEQSSNNKAN